MTTPIYELHAVEQRRGSKLVLRIPALTIGAGRIYTLVGPNGSGKTTLLTVLGFLAPPSAGELRFAGEKVVWSSAALLPLRRQVTLVQQSPYLFAGTVGDNLAVGLAHRKLDREAIRERVAGALEAVALAGYERRSARALSQGETQRVAFARALLLEARVLLLDEPLSNLDRRSSAVLEELIGRLPAAGCTVIISSHDPQHPSRFGSEVIALREGALASPDDDACEVDARAARPGWKPPRRADDCPAGVVTLAAARGGARTIG